MAEGGLFGGLFGGGGGEAKSQKFEIKDKDYAKTYLGKVAAEYAGSGDPSQREFGENLKKLSQDDAFMTHFLKTNKLEVLPTPMNGRPVVDLKPIITSAQEFYKNEKPEKPGEKTAHQTMVEALSGSFSGKEQWTVGAPPVDKGKTNDSSIGTILNFLPLVSMLFMDFPQSLLVAGIGILAMNMFGVGDKISGMLGYGPSAKGVEHDPNNTPQPAREPGRENYTFPEITTEQAKNFTKPEEKAVIQYNEKDKKEGMVDVGEINVNHGNNKGKYIIRSTFGADGRSTSTVAVKIGDDGKPTNTQFVLHDYSNQKPVIKDGDKGIIVVKNASSVVNDAQAQQMLKASYWAMSGQNTNGLKFIATDAKPNVKDAVIVIGSPVKSTDGKMELPVATVQSEDDKTTYTIKATVVQDEKTKQFSATRLEMVDAAGKPVFVDGKGVFKDLSVSPITVAITEKDGSFSLTDDAKKKFTASVTPHVTDLTNQAKFGELRTDVKPVEVFTPLTAGEAKAAEVKEDVEIKTISGKKYLKVGTQKFTTTEGKTIECDIIAVGSVDATGKIAPEKLQYMQDGAIVQVGGKDFLYELKDKDKVPYAPLEPIQTGTKIVGTSETAFVSAAEFEKFKTSIENFTNNFQDVSKAFDAAGKKAQETTTAAAKAHVNSGLIIKESDQNVTPPFDLAELKKTQLIEGTGFRHTNPKLNINFDKLGYVVAEQGGKKFVIAGEVTADGKKLDKNTILVIPYSNGFDKAADAPQQVKLAADFDPTTVQKGITDGTLKKAAGIPNEVLPPPKAVAEKPAATLPAPASNAIGHIAALANSGTGVAASNLSSLLDKAVKLVDEGVNKPMSADEMGALLEKRLKVNPDGNQYLGTLKDNLGKATKELNENNIVYDASPYDAGIQDQYMLCRDENNKLVIVAGLRSDTGFAPKHVLQTQEQPCGNAPTVSLSTPSTPINPSELTLDKDGKVNADDLNRLQPFITQAGAYSMNIDAGRTLQASTTPKVEIKGKGVGTV